jgi:hypothetical protein
MAQEAERRQVFDLPAKLIAEALGRPGERQDPCL